MTLYNIVDHRAPVWFPHKAENYTNDAIIWVPLLIAGTVGVPIIIPSLIYLGLWYLVPLFLLLMFAWYKYCRHWVYPIQRDGDLRDYFLNEQFERIQRLYRNNPGVQEELEPILSSCYKFIPSMDSEAIGKRLTLMQKIVDSQLHVPAVQKTDYELEEFKTDFEIRTQVQREMREQGLL